MSSLALPTTFDDAMSQFNKLITIYAWLEELAGHLDDANSRESFVLLLRHVNLLLGDQYAAIWRTVHQCPDGTLQTCPPCQGQEAPTTEAPVR